MIQRIITFVFVLVSIFLISWQGKNFFHEFPTNFYFFETILLLGSISLFLYETFHSNIVLNIKSYFPFWVSICLIMVYVGLLPLLFFVQQMGVSISADLFRLIMLFVNFMGYSILIVGILNSKKIKE
ncbi:MAG: hypothetical protein LBE36_08795 [Flavobacteriaceae bacterium]|nr:hypothetical protein [Flavobacteriaceae bacterium]